MKCPNSSILAHKDHPRWALPTINNNLNNKHTQLSQTPRGQLLFGHIMEALKAYKIIGNRNDWRGRGCVFISSRYRIRKGFKFHAQPQTGAYSC